MEEIRLLFCGHEKCAPSHSYGPAVRHAYLLHYIIRGNGMFSVVDSDYPLGEGEFFLIKPEEITFYKADGADPWEYAWISFEGERAEDMLRHAGLLETPVGRAQNPQAVEKRICELIDIYKNAPHNMLEQTSLVYGVFAQLLGAPTGVVKDEYIKEAMQFIRHNYSFNIKISDIANHVGIDRTYLYKLFRRETGISPKEYLTDYRLRKARELLVQTNMSVSQVAASCGYSEIAPFSRQFKRKFGTPPSGVRYNAYHPDE